MVYKNKKDWVPADEFKLEVNALESVKSFENILVVAGPGAGKTELLAQRACYLLETNICKYPQKILAISFKRDAARNLKERVVKRCGEELAMRFESLTFDAFAKQILDRFHRGLPSVYSLKGEYEIFFEEQIIIDAYKNENNRFISNISKQKLLDFHYAKLPVVVIEEKHALREKVWMNLLNKDNSQLSFKMVMLLAELIMNCNPKVKQYLQATYSYVFLDEFQDTTSLQYEFLNSCFDGSNAIFTAVGDDKQRIMLWAGANPEIFETFLSKYSANKISLIMNFRSAPRLVALQNFLVKNLMNKRDDVIPSDKWAKETGEAFIWIYKDANSEKRHLLDRVKELITKDGIKPCDICILVKQQLSVYVGDLIEYFNNNGVKARDESILQDLLTEEPVRYIINVLIYACNRKASEAKLEAICFLGNVNTEYEDVQMLALEQKFNRFVLLLKKKIKTDTSIEMLKSIVTGIIEFAGIDRVKAFYPNYRNENYLNDFLNKLFVELTNNLEKSISLKEALDTLIGKDSLPVMTIHKSKGLEYNTVFFVGLEDGAFWNYVKQTNEDQCAFFVALSRAMERVVFTCCKTRINRWGNNQNQEIVNIKDVFLQLKRSGIVEIEKY